MCATSESSTTVYASDYFVCFIIHKITQNISDPSLLLFYFIFSSSECVVGRLSSYLICILQCLSSFSLLPISYRIKYALVQEFLRTAK
uniref:Uncharacterized protein n=1 Tax=Aegilops tauschii subsp. strangulata TaxID=200361 RepID=A0A453IWC2_AEGTS